MRYVEKSILLQTLDHLWREHLVMLDHLRQVIGLRGYGQRDPLNEYKTEAFNLFETMITRPARGDDLAADAGRDRGCAAAGQQPPTAAGHGSAQDGPDHRRGRDGFGDGRRGNAARPASALPRAAHAPAAGGRGAGAKSDPSSWGKVGRNEPCPCGSGKKFKHCHGRYA